MMKTTAPPFVGFVGDPPHCEKTMHSLSYIDLSEVRETPVSAFRDVRSIDPMPTTLGAWMEGCKRPNGRQQRFADICQQVRQANDEATRKALKLTLPAVTSP